MDLVTTLVCVLTCVRVCVWEMCARACEREGGWVDFGVGSGKERGVEFRENVVRDGSEGLGG